MKKTANNHDASGYILESARLKFRQITHEDFASLKEMLSDPKVLYAWEHTFTDDQIHDWIQTQLSYYRQDNAGYFAAIEKTTGAFVGQMGLHRCEFNQQSIFEVCYMLKHRYWHYGYALEGVRALTNYAFREISLPEVYAQIKTNNAPSIAVAESAGFEKKATFIKHYNGKNMEHFLYAKTKECLP
ncbi:GNAT family N-acetyltransferase [Desulfosporosinus nitroreducens]|uniref:GNAT family N-acetyltransferase n=1 Tax=Desulfosporosinus nitroreducens TaxID=2018668 RepID=UPI00207CA71C|nr:GNAT family N-acetyltransferase [Desulfosporosinus nitroreducens]MCO1604310.1 GNAT family N-acetyltransferase [Desulfosporosinus nitroreducens]